MAVHGMRLLSFCALAGLTLASSDGQEALSLRAHANDKANLSSMDETMLGKGCSFCVQANINFNFKANFDKLSKAIAGVASEIGDVTKTLGRMEKDITKEMKSIAKGIEDLAKSIAMNAAAMLVDVALIDRFIQKATAEVDLSILVDQVAHSIQKIQTRQPDIDKLMKNPTALPDEYKQRLVTGILDINEGAKLDALALHSAIAGGLVPGVKPALEVYIAKGYRLNKLAQVFGTLFGYQVHAYGQLFWATMNKRPDIALFLYNDTQDMIRDNLDVQWRDGVFGASQYLWNCYWDNGFTCPVRQECHSKLLGKQNFTCNSAKLPFSLTEDARRSVTTHTIGAPSTDMVLKAHGGYTPQEAHGYTGYHYCHVGVADCNGLMAAPMKRLDYDFDRRRRGNPGYTKCKHTRCTADFNTNGTLTLHLQALDSSHTVCGSKSENYPLTSDRTKGPFSVVVLEDGKVQLEGINNVALASWNGPPTPKTGECPTSFANRALRPFSTAPKCQCIETTRWTTVATGLTNITGSHCGRLCQADPQYVASSPQVNGECWCGTKEVLQKPASPQDCNATCTVCPGAPVETCGANSSVAIYTWSGAAGSLTSMTNRGETLLLI